MLIYTFFWICFLIPYQFVKLQHRFKSYLYSKCLIRFSKQNILKRKKKKKKGFVHIINHYPKTKTPSHIKIHKVLIKKNKDTLQGNFSDVKRVKRIFIIYFKFIDPSQKQSKFKLPLFVNEWHLKHFLKLRDLLI